MSMLGWFGVVSAAWGGEEPMTLVIEAVVSGDFDGSGGLDEATLFSTASGEVFVDVALDVPELSEPTSSSTEGLALKVVDLEGDKLEDLLVTAADTTFSLPGGDESWLLVDAREGGGDKDPDIQVTFKQNGAKVELEVEKFDRDQVCRQVCDKTEVQGTWPCGLTQGGPILCPLVVCTSWKTSCRTF